MAEKNNEGSKAVLIRMGQNFKKSKIAFKVGLTANAISVLAFVLCLLRIFPLYTSITFGVCILIAFFAYGVLLIDTLIHRVK